MLKVTRPIYTEAKGGSASNVCSEAQYDGISCGIASVACRFEFTTLDEDMTAFFLTVAVLRLFFLPGIFNAQYENSRTDAPEGVSGNEIRVAISMVGGNGTSCIPMNLASNTNLLAAFVANDDDCLLPLKGV